jgi:hypothetical protein
VIGCAKEKQHLRLKFSKTNNSYTFPVSVVE